MLSVRDLEDAWYRTGSYYHLDQLQEGRTILAAAELQEWLEIVDPPPGNYVICMTELDITTGVTGQAWASVRLTHTRQVV